MYMYVFVYIYIYIYAYVLFTGPERGNGKGVTIFTCLMFLANIC